MEEVNVAIGEVKYRTHIQTGKHSLVADEPVDLGGGDEGPGPTEYLLSSLGACTAITLRMYADRKEWPLEAVDVKLSLSQHKEGGNLSTTIQRNIELKGDLSSEQKERLMRIADKCPVHKILSNPIEIDSKLL